MGGFTTSPSPSPSPQALDDEENDDGSGDDDDEDEDASCSGDEEMTASQWLTICHSWQKGRVVLSMRVVMYLGGELVYDIFYRRNVYIWGM